MTLCAKVYCVKVTCKIFQYGLIGLELIQVRIVRGKVDQVRIKIMGVDSGGNILGENCVGGNFARVGIEWFPFYENVLHIMFKKIIYNYN